MRLLDSKIYLEDIRKAISLTETSFLRNKKVLITGATGLIGSAIIDYLIVLNRDFEANITIYAAARNRDKVEKRFGNEVKYVEYDALMPININAVDYIVHGASNASPERFSDNPVETMLANLNGVNNLLEYCKGNNAIKMIYISSSEVYGIKNTIDSFSEKEYGYVDLDNIRNSYAEAKRAAEMLCKAYASEYNVQVCMVRPGHIFGPSATREDKRISSDFAYKAASGHNLNMLSAGEQIRSYCYSVDCASAILTTLNKGISGEAYNIGTNETISIREMASILASEGKVVLSIKEPTKEERRSFNPMDNSSLDGSKLFALGYAQCFNIREGLEHTIQILKGCIE